MQLFMIAAPPAAAVQDIMLQFNPEYKVYVLHTDGGPSDNVKRKKFRGKKKRGPSFSLCVRWVGLRQGVKSCSA